VVTRQLQIDRETGKFAGQRPTFSPLCHATNRLRGTVVM